MYALEKRERKNCQRYALCSRRWPLDRVKRGLPDEAKWRVVYAPDAQINEAQMERYIDLLHQGEDALKEHTPTVAERTAAILRTISADIAHERQDYRYEAMTPEEFRAELKRQQEAEREWKEHMKTLKKRAAATRGLSEAG